jgi:hypothetical protein
MNNLSRRECLRFGAALPLAIHSLNLRAATKAKQPQPPRRIMFICNSLGFHEPYFFPQTRGDLSSSKYLGRMATKDKMTVLQNFFHPGMDTSNHDSEKSFLTGTPKPEAPNFINGISVDQLLARHLGGETRFPSLALSIYDRGWGCSWNRQGVAIPPLHDETQLFNKLFGEEDLAAKRQQILDDQRVVQCLYRDMEQLQVRASGAAKVESYRTVIAKLEQQLRHEAFWLERKKPQVNHTLRQDPQFAFSTKIQNLLELSKLAFQTDSTRVITFSLDWIYGAINVPGASGGWHTLSHHGGNQDVLQKLSCIEREIVKHLDQFLSELDQIEDGDGTLLDHTTVVIGSNFGDSSNHTCNNLPTIVAGGGYRHRQHTVLDKPTPLCNLWLELLHKHDVDAAQFGSAKKDMGLL